MNLTTKKLIFIIASLLAVIAITASCSKEPQAGDAKKAKKTVKVDTIAPAGQNTLNATRSGQYANLTWHVGKSGKISQVYVLRSLTGVKKRSRVADLDPSATSFKDCLPNANAQWYWVRVIADDGKFQDIGPVRVAADRAGAANYIKQDTDYKATITRTDDVATIAWDFPGNEYKSITVARYPRPVSEPFNGPKDGAIKMTTMEARSQYTDALPDPNADYWYWFRVTLKTGAVIYKGPVKAEYPKRTLPSAKSGK